MKTTASFLITTFWGFLALLLVFAFTGCAHYSSGPEGVRLTMVGTNADGIVATAEGIQFAGLNQSEGLRIVGQTTSTVTGLMSLASVAKAESADAVAKHKSTDAANVSQNASNNAVRTTDIIETNKTAREALMHAAP
jgi:hypothetical protein